MTSVHFHMLSLHLYKTIFIILHIACSTSRAFINPSNNIENDSGFVSFDDIRPSLLFPAGTGDFGKGTIDLGGLEVYKVLYFKKIWEIQSGGPKGLGASFYEPTSIPIGFHLLGHYCKPNSKAMFAVVLTAKDTMGDLSHGVLKSPIDYTLIWTSEGMNVSRRQDGYIWLPIPPKGYKAVGHIVTTSPEKPSLDKVRCVRSDYTDLAKVDKWIWGHKMLRSSSIVNLHTIKPKASALSVPAGTFLAQNGSNTHELACLKMVKNNPYSAMPDSAQIDAMMHAYAPYVYFHPDEEYFPSSVSWFFDKGVQLYQNGQATEAIVNDGDNLPTTGRADDAFLDLPYDEADRERVKKGSLSDAVAYIHVKRALGGICTDLAIWLYYPFNGGGKFQLGPYTINLGRIGEHVSDWEHITLRVDNFYGTLQEVYLSQHAKGKWLRPREFERMKGTRPVVYAALHGHAHYETPSPHIHVAGKLDPSDVRMLYDEYQKMNTSRKSPVERFTGFGVRDDAAKSDNVMDIASTYNVICIDYKDCGVKPWVKYTGRWGPKFTYDFIKEATEIVQYLPNVVKRLAFIVLPLLPDEVIGQEGPQGPKMKESWSRDERV